ncbi:uncharacterized protein LOC119686002 [Teleopsis dalmanni]|uniref:uncharacterized protein LOC119686002 n=1 Tax=Teleopsis dalmanni TaxID=139649 RepID=UPI0018CEBAD4|nr:uncharacterized protein LOC119686002 [Teleopsis dalmanni]
MTSKILICICSIVVLQSHFMSCLKFVSHKDCNNVRKGTFVAHPSNCNQYIQCNGLRSTLGTCSEGTYFNPEVLSCDSSSDACKKKSTTSKDSVDSQHISNTINSNVEVENLLSGKQNFTISTFDGSADVVINNDSTDLPFNRPQCTSWLDQQFPHPHNCQYYYYCAKGSLTLRRCQAGFGWDLDHRKCISIQEAKCFKH